RIDTVHLPRARLRADRVVPRIDGGGAGLEWQRLDRRLPRREAAETERAEERGRIEDVARARNAARVVDQIGVPRDRPREVAPARSPRSRAPPATIVFVRVGGALLAMPPPLCALPPPSVLFVTVSVPARLKIPPPLPLVVFAVLLEKVLFVTMSVPWFSMP